MITEEERASLKVGDIAYYVRELSKKMFEGVISEINENTVYFNEYYCDISDKELFNNKKDALQEFKAILNDEIDELESKVRSIDDQINQLERLENGKQRDK